MRPLYIFIRPMAEWYDTVVGWDEGSGSSAHCSSSPTHIIMWVGQFHTCLVQHINHTNMLYTLDTSGNLYKYLAVRWNTPTTGLCSVIPLDRGTETRYSWAFFSYVKLVKPWYISLGRAISLRYWYYDWPEPVWRDMPQSERVVSSCWRWPVTWDRENRTNPA